MDYSKLTPQELIRECAWRPTPEAADEFVRRFSKCIASGVSNILYSYRKYSRELLEELTQEGFVKLWANDRKALKDLDAMTDGQPEDFPCRYLWKMGCNIARDYFKGQGARKRGSGKAPENVDDVQPPSASGSMGGANEMEWQILKRQLEATLKKKLGYTDEEIRIFRYYYYQEGYSAEQISKLPGVTLSVKGVESLIHRMSKDLKEFFGDDEGP